MELILRDSSDSSPDADTATFSEVRDGRVVEGDRIVVSLNVASVEDNTRFVAAGLNLSRGQCAAVIDFLCDVLGLKYRVESGAGKSVPTGLDPRDALLRRAFRALALHDNASRDVVALSIAAHLIGEVDHE